MANSIFTFQAQSPSSDQEILRLAFTTLLRRKGRVLDTMLDTIMLLRQRAASEDQELLTRYLTIRSQLSNWTLKGVGETKPEFYYDKLKQFEEQFEKLEAEIGARNAKFKVQTQPLSFETIKAQIPAGAILLEFAQYSPINAQTGKVSSISRYTAYILNSQGQLNWLDLGEATVIDQAVEQFRQALCQPQPGELRCLPQPLSIVRARARALDELVMRPVRNLFGATKHVLISPDGMLNLIPFTALVDESNHYLAEEYSFNYLTSGRDLLRFQTKQESKPAALVLADPAFDSQSSTITAAQRDIKPVASGSQSGMLSFDFADAKFGSLAGTAREARALKQLLSEATVLTREQATEAALKQVSRPRLLHIATHGFFLPDLKLNTGEVTTSARAENPLLRSGLALAGANLRKGDSDDDGILTALEAAGLDLWGTKLVVLSACDTGVGEVRNGDGVYGLRRAFVLAGSETQVMSLWSVSDQATKELMVAYYKRLLRGEGRGEALRQVQLQMLKQPNRRHPFYWASFIQSGEWANLDGRR